MKKLTRDRVVPALLQVVDGLAFASLDKENILRFQVDYLAAEPGVSKISWLR